MVLIWTFYTSHTTIDLWRQIFDVSFAEMVSARKLRFDTIGLFSMERRWNVDAYKTETPRHLQVNIYDAIAKIRPHTPEKMHEN